MPSETAKTVLVLSWVICEGLGGLVLYLFADDLGLPTNPVQKFAARLFGMSICGLAAVTALMLSKNIRSRTSHWFVSLMSRIESEAPTARLEHIVDDKAWLRLGGVLVCVDLLGLTVAYLNMGMGSVLCGTP